jgi:DNA repair protein RadD
MISARPYQERTVDAVVARWRLGPCRIAVVAPTGAGKTVIGGLIIARYPGQKWVWLAHTRDLVLQSAAALERMFPGEVGIIMAGHAPSPFARIQVCSVQTLTARGYLPDGWLILDEMHHYGAEEWQAFVEKLGDRPAVWLTATPARADGVGLRGLFHDITVAAHYSELIEGGFIVSCRVLRPKRRIQGIAQDPVTAYLAKGEGRTGFTFCRTIEIARDTAAKYTAFGVPAACVDAETPSEERRAAIAGLGSGRYQMLTSVYALTEGVDVPSASVCVLARGIGHPGGLCQMAGRVLRAAPGKTDALLLDLSGVTWDLGLPHEDREYSLDGMQRKPGAESLRVCQSCGYTETSGVALCTRCGFKLPPKDLRPKVTGEEIGEHSQLEKDLRLSALLVEAKRKGYADDWVATNFKKLTGCVAKLPHDVDRKMLTYEKFKAAARASGYSMAYAASRFRALYGSYPPRNW